MPTYILLSKLTEAGRKTVKKKPARTKEVNKEIEAMGGKVLAQYAVLGPYDYVSVVEARDNETIARISIELGSRGTVEIMTLAAALTGVARPPSSPARRRRGCRRAAAAAPRGAERAPGRAQGSVAAAGGSGGCGRPARGSRSRSSGGRAGAPPGRGRSRRRRWRRAGAR